MFMVHGAPRVQSDARGMREYDLIADWFPTDRGRRAARHMMYSPAPCQSPANELRIFLVDFSTVEGVK
jgi:hypothetical protein